MPHLAKHKHAHTYTQTHTFPGLYEYYDARYANENAEIKILQKRLF